MTQSPDEVFVDELGEVRIGSDGVFILTQLPSKTQVFEETEEELPSFLSANHIIVLRLLFLQRLKQRNRGCVVLTQYKMDRS